MTEDDDKSIEDVLKKEMAKLEREEQLLRSQDNNLKQKEEILRTESLERQHYEDTPLDPGVTYLVLESVPERSIGLFIKEMKAGMDGLLLTRSNPNHMRSKYDLGNAKVMWIAGLRAPPGIITIAGLQELSIVVSDAIDMNPKTVVLLDGIEYLISNNDFPLVLKLVQQIRDRISTFESKLIIPLNPDALESRQLTLLQRECHTLK